MSNVASVLKKYVLGPVVTSVGATVAAATAGGAMDAKAMCLVFVGAFLGAVLHKEVVVRFVGED